MVGRKPKPTALKMLAGNPGKRPLNDREAKPAQGMPRCPNHLDGEARREWHRIRKDLYKAGLLYKIDRAALAAYCQAYSTWVAACQLVASEGLTYESEKGNTLQHPGVSIMLRAQDTMLKICSEFGMTPSSRSRVKADPPGAAAPTLADKLFTGIKQDA